MSSRSTGASRLIRKTNAKSNSLNFRSSGQISIAEVGDEFVGDFEFRGNAD